MCLPPRSGSPISSSTTGAPFIARELYVLLTEPSELSVVTSMADRPTIQYYMYSGTMSSCHALSALEMCHDKARNKCTVTLSYSTKQQGYGRACERTAPTFLAFHFLNVV